MYTSLFAGLPLAVGVGIYTGVLLGAVQSRPFWNTNLVAQMFLFSALSTGCAALILTLLLSRSAPRSPELRFLYTLDIGFLHLEFFIVLPYLIHGQLSVQAVRDSLHLILGGPFTIVFWFFFWDWACCCRLAWSFVKLCRRCWGASFTPANGSPPARRCWCLAAVFCCATSSSLRAR
jgi:Ni/Fe-hydrogenase subunit HybB-like protein